MLAFVGIGALSFAFVVLEFVSMNTTVFYSIICGFSIGIFCSLRAISQTKVLLRNGKYWYLQKPEVPFIMLGLLVARFMYRMFEFGRPTTFAQLLAIKDGGLDPFSSVIVGVVLVYIGMHSLGVLWLMRKKRSLIVSDISSL
jgi:hypothetical protein